MDKILYCNGDSGMDSTDPYPKDNIGSARPVFPEFLSQLLGMEFVNQAIAGSSNDRIFRTTLEDCIKFKNQNITPHVVIGLSFITREEVWNENALDHVIYQFNKTTQGKLVTRDYLSRGQLSSEDLHRLIDTNINAQVIHFYANLYMLVNTFENLNIPYFMFSSATNRDWKELNWDYLKTLEIYKLINQNKNILDIHNINIPSWARERNIPILDKTWHLAGPDEHKMFAEYLYADHLSKWKKN